MGNPNMGECGHNGEHINFVLMRMVAEYWVGFTKAMFLTHGIPRLRPVRNMKR